MKDSVKTFYLKIKIKGLGTLDSFNINLVLDYTVLIIKLIQF